MSVNMNVTVPVGSVGISLRHRMAAINAWHRVLGVPNLHGRARGSGPEYRNVEPVRSTLPCCVDP